MEKLAAEIKEGRFRRVYLFCGEETYLIRQYKHRLIEAALGDGVDMNLSLFEGKNCDENEIIDQAQTMPFFADYRLVCVQDSGFFKKAPADAFVEYIDRIPETTILLFVESEVDKRLKLYKKVSKEGRVVSFDRMKEAVLKKWVLSILKKEDKKITESVMNLFLEAVGDDMELISRELEKLISYTMGRDAITAADVQAVCVPSVNNRIFAMLDAIAQKDRSKAMKLYSDLILLREPPMRILVLLGRQFHILLQLKGMQQAGIGPREMASKAKLPPFAVKKNLAQAAKFSAASLQQAIDRCVRADADIKSGRLTDRMAVELVMLESMK